MIFAPRSSSASCVMALTVAAVPTGMNAGVSITLCGVVRRPRRPPARSLCKTSKEKCTLRVYQEKINAQMVFTKTTVPQTENAIR